MEEMEIEEVGFSDPHRFAFSVSYALDGRSDDPITLNLTLTAEDKQEALLRLFAVIGDRSLSEAVASASSAGAEIDIPAGVGYSEGELSLEQLEVTSRKIQGEDLDTGEEVEVDRIDEFFLG